MNYERIYREFIAHRRGLEEALTGYSERHHIVPRSMGGDDSRANLIRLSAEDHFFAHLLLAKAFGGAQWGGVHCMAQMANDATSARRSVFASRYMFGVARRKFAEFQSNRRSGSRDAYRDRVATLYNDDGRVERGSRTELVKATGLNLASVSRLCTGKQGRSACGWYADGTASENAKAMRIEQGRKYSRAGLNRLSVCRERCGTIYVSLTEAAAATGTNTSNIARAIRRQGEAAGTRWSYHDAQGAA